MERCGRHHPGAGRAGLQLAVLFMYFDRFKQVNDTLAQRGRRTAAPDRPTPAAEVCVPATPIPPAATSARWPHASAGMNSCVLDDIRGDLDAEIVASRLLDVLAQPYLIESHTVQLQRQHRHVTSTHAAMMSKPFCATPTLPCTRQAHRTRTLCPVRTLHAQAGAG